MYQPIHIHNLLQGALSMPAETIPPLAIIVGAIALMGASQGWIHKAYYSKPKAVGQDVWDRAAVTRDDRVKSQAGST